MDRINCRTFCDNSIWIEGMVLRRFPQLSPPLSSFQRPSEATVIVWSMKRAIAEQLDYICKNVDAMSDIEKIQLFESKKVRTVWDDTGEKWYFSVVDVCGILTEQPTPKRASTYWAVLKGRLKKEGAGELLTTCKQLKLTAADGKPYPTDTADAQTMFRIIQSIPSKKAEPFKQWMARVASERIDEIQDPELAILRGA